MTENLKNVLLELLKKHGIKSIMIENMEISLNLANRLQMMFNSLNINLLMDDTLDILIEDIRMIKSNYEIDYIKKAQRLTDLAFENALSNIKVGKTEKDLALEIEFFMRKNGAEGVSFNLIVVSGENSSLPHGEPGNRQFKNGDFITMDIGAVYNGYCSDMTRTVALGNVNEEQKYVYDTVLKAQNAALKCIKPDVCCSLVDKAARELIYNAGFKGCFGHSTGHSLGLDIHEEPRFYEKSNKYLQPGMVMTVEPGIYIPNKFGVRIEDMILVTEEGYENLTASSKELIVI